MVIDFWSSPGKMLAFLKETGLSVADTFNIPNSWNNALGMMGEQIFELLAHYYSPRLSFEVKPPLPDLEERVRKALFWQSTPVIRTTLSADSASALGKGGRSFSSVFEDVFRDSLLEKLGYHEWMRLREAFHRCGFHQSRFESLLCDSFEKCGLWNEMDDHMMHCIVGGVWTTAFYATGFLLVGDKSKNFRPLLDLWRSGNLPIGFDAQRVPALLVAE